MIYVQYKEVQQAKVARMALQGRMFAGRKVEGWFYPVDKYAAKEWVHMLNEFGPAEELNLDIPVAVASAKTQRACRMIDGKWTEISPIGSWGDSGGPMGRRN